MTLEIIPRSEIGLRPPNTDRRHPFNVPPSDRKGGVLHSNGRIVGFSPNATIDQEKRFLRAVQRWHMDNNGWSDIAYSWAVFPSGRIYELRGLSWDQFGNGEDQVGQNDGPDRVWYTIFYVGGDDGDWDNPNRDKPTPAAKASVEALIAMIRDEGAGDRVLPHNEFKRKTCPGKELSAYADELDGQPIGDDMAPPMDQWHKVFNDAANGDSDGIITWFQRGLVKLGHYAGPDTDDSQEWGVMKGKLRLAWTAYEVSKGYANPNDRPGRVSLRHFQDDLDATGEPPTAPPAASDTVKAMFAEYQTQNIAAMDRIAGAINS